MRRKARDRAVRTGSIITMSLELRVKLSELTCCEKRAFVSPRSAYKLYTRSRCGRSRRLRLAARRKDARLHLGPHAHARWVVARLDALPDALHVLLP